MTFLNPNIQPVTAYDMAGMKDTNPKYANGEKKIPLASVPPILISYAAVGFHEGKLKYGAWNWRVGGASAHTYISACKRHLDAWYNGEEVDPHTGSPHLANALACIGIILDARVQGKLVDDRPPIQENYAAEVAWLHAAITKLQETFGGCTPHHHSILDRPQQGEVNGQG